MLKIAMMASIVIFTILTVPALKDCDRLTIDDMKKLKAQQNGEKYISKSDIATTAWLISGIVAITLITLWILMEVKTWH